MALLLSPFHSLGERDLTAWETLYMVGLSGLALFAAPVVAFACGLWAALAGHRSGALAAGLAAVMLAVLLFAAITGGWLDTTPAIRSLGV